MKKMILLSFALFFVGFIPHVFAEGFVALAPIPGLTQGATADTKGLADFFNNLYKFAVGLSAALAVIMIIWGGLEYSTQDSISKKSDGKQRIYNAIFGLVLVLSPVLVFSIINPSILNLSLNLPKLDTASTPTQTTTSPTYQNTDLQQLGAQIQQTYGENPSAQIEIPIRSGTDQEQQNVSAQCKVNTGGSKNTAVKGMKDGYYVCI